MFFIFGWNHRNVSPIGPVYQHTCPNCHNSEYWQLQKVSHYFTLFFIPIFPTDTKYWYYCPVCSRGVEIDTDTAKQYKMIAEANTAFLNNAITESELSQRVNSANTAIKQIEGQRQIKYLKESTDFKDIAAQKTDEELLAIARSSPDNYNPAFIIAVQHEMKHRNLNDIL